MEQIIARLEAVGIRLIATYEDTRHYAFEREGLVAIVAIEPGRPTRVGGAGLLTENGLAPLVWRGDQAFFVARNFELMANQEQIEAVRSFQHNLSVALSEGGGSCTQAGS